jgi:hypothetical protein
MVELVSQQHTFHILFAIGSFFSLDQFNLKMSHDHKIGSYASSVVVRNHV